MNPAGEKLQALLAKFPEISSIEPIVPDLNGILRGKRVLRELLVARRFEGQAFDAQVSDLDYGWHLRAQ